MQIRPTKSNQQNININLNVKGRFNTLTELNTSYPTGSEYAFAVGTPQSNEVYVWNNTAWVNIGSIKGATGVSGQPGQRGEPGVEGEKGERGYSGRSLEFSWNGGSLGVRLEGAATYTYVDLKGDKGDKGLTGDKGDKGLTGDKGETGTGLEFTWNGTQLGVRAEGEIDYSYIDLKGEKGDDGDKGEQGEQGEQGDVGTGLNFVWNGTQLGIKREDEESYQYIELQGVKGDKGDDGDKGDVGEQGEQGEQGYTPIKNTDYFDGKSLEYIWNGTQLGIRQEGELEYQYVNLKGEKGDKGLTGDKGATGDSIEFHWDGTNLGVKIEGEPVYQYIDLQGEAGTPGTSLNLNVSRQYDTYEDLPTNPDIGYMCLVGSDLYIFTEDGWVNAGKLTDIDLDIYTNIDGGLFTDEYGVTIGESALEALQDHTTDDDTHANLIIDGMEV